MPYDASLHGANSQHAVSSPTDAAVTDAGVHAAGVPQEPQQHSMPPYTAHGTLPALRLTPGRILLLVGLGAATLFLLLYWGGGAATLTLLAQADWHWLLLAVGVHYGGFVLRGYRWQTLLHGLGHHLHYGYVLSVLLAGWFASALLPARAGDALRVVALRMPGQTQPVVPAADSLGTIVLERALDILAILALSAGFGLWVLEGQAPGWLLGVYAGALALLAGVGVAILAMPGILNRVRGWFANRWWQRGVDFALHLAASLRKLPRRSGVSLLLMGESLAIWLCDWLLLWLVARSLGQSLALAAAGFVALTVDIFAAVPLTPGGMGQIETAYAVLLALIGQSDTIAIAAIVLLTRAISYWSFLAVSGGVTAAAGLARRLTPAQPQSL